MPSHVKEPMSAAVKLSATVTHTHRHTHTHAGENQSRPHQSHFIASLRFALFNLTSAATLSCSAAPFFFFIYIFQVLRFLAAFKGSQTQNMR